MIDDGVHRVELDVRGYVGPPAGAPVPPLEVPPAGPSGGCPG